jgi:hypothetical protein
MHQRAGWVTNLGTVNDGALSHQQQESSSNSEQRTLLAVSHQWFMNLQAVISNGSGNDGHAACSTMYFVLKGELNTSSQAALSGPHNVSEATASVITDTASSGLQDDDGRVNGWWNMSVSR